MTQPNPLPSHFSTRCLQVLFAVKRVYVVQGITIAMQGPCLLGTSEISSIIFPNGKDGQTIKKSRHQM